MTITTIPHMFTEKEAAQLLGISPWTLRSNRSKGVGIPYYKVGGRVKYRLDDINEWLHGKRVVPSGVTVG